MIIKMAKAHRDFLRVDTDLFVGFAERSLKGAFM